MAADVDSEEDVKSTSEEVEETEAEEESCLKQEEQEQEEERRAKQEKKEAGEATAYESQFVAANDIEDEGKETSASCWGPTDLSGIIQVGHGAAEVARLCSKAEVEQDERVLNEVRHLPELQVVFTSSFSATGGFEKVGVDVVDGYTKYAPRGNHPTKEPVCYSTWDNWQVALDALGSHSGRSRPLHRFGSVLERLHSDDLERLKKVEATNLAAWNSICDDYMMGNIPKLEKQRWREVLREKMLGEMLAEFEKTTFRFQAWCYEHNQFCFISPRASIELRDALWYEGAGSPCPPHSSMGAGKKTK